MCAIKSYIKKIKVDRICTVVIRSVRPLSFWGQGEPLGYDLLDRRIKSMHANFQVSDSLSKKVPIFFPKKKFHVNFSTAVAFFQNLYSLKNQLLQVNTKYGPAKLGFSGCINLPLNVYKNISKELPM